LQQRELLRNSRPGAACAPTSTDARFRAARTGGRVNKWMVRFWGVLALLALGALIGTTVWPAVP